MEGPSTSPSSHVSRWQKWRTRRVGITLGCGAVVLGLLTWYLAREAGERPWTTRAIAADFQDVTVQKPEPDGEKAADVHLIFRYALTNLTDKEYRIPAPSHGVVMQHLPEGGLQQLDSVLWDSQLSIPARKTANVAFDVALSPAAYEDAGPEDQHEHGAKDVAPFSSRRLQEIRGLVFFDYANRYVIELPRGWD